MPLKSKEVKEVQTKLRSMGYLGENDVDGIYGPKTKSAVKAFQRKAKLKVDGVIGKNTQKALLRAFAEHNKKNPLKSLLSWFYTKEALENSQATAASDKDKNAKEQDIVKLFLATASERLKTVRNSVYLAISTKKKPIKWSNDSERTKFYKSIDIEEIKQAFADKGYQLKEDGALNIVGIRDANLATNKFDDHLYLLYQAAGEMKLESFKNITTDPGFATKEKAKKILKDPKRKGMAVLKPGQSKRFIGLHKGHPALMQYGTVSVYRDVTIKLRGSKDDELEDTLYNDSAKEGEKTLRQGFLDLIYDNSTKEGQAKGINIHSRFRSSQSRFFWYNHLLKDAGEGSGSHNDSQESIESEKIHNKKIWKDSHKDKYKKKDRGKKGANKECCEGYNFCSPKKCWDRVSKKKTCAAHAYYLHIREKIINNDAIMKPVPDASDPGMTYYDAFMDFFSYSEEHGITFGQYENVSGYSEGCTVFRYKKHFIRFMRTCLARANTHREKTFTYTLFDPIAFRHHPDYPKKSANEKKHKGAPSIRHRITPLKIQTS